MQSLYPLLTCRERVFYLPMHPVVKESSSTTKIHAVFDVSAKTTSGISLKDQLMVGPTVHSSLVDVLLRFRLNRIALTADVSKMYRAIVLPPEDRDYHRFLWRNNMDEGLKDYWMTRVTFGVSSSSFVANMCLKQNAIDHAQPLWHPQLFTMPSMWMMVFVVQTPRLELCGANLLANLLHHLREVLGVSSNDVFAWTDSKVVLGWLAGIPRHFKTFIGNRVSNILELLSPDRSHHVPGSENPADCASRGLFPSELLHHKLWWNGPEWMQAPKSQWPIEDVATGMDMEQTEVSSHVVTTSTPKSPVLEPPSSFTQLKRVTAWTMRFVRNCKLSQGGGNPVQGPLLVDELRKAEESFLCARSTYVSYMPDPLLLLPH